jgi:uroporphyrinogen decarboxylase
MMNQPPVTSRERLLATIEHREPDHLAVDLGSTPSSGISAVAHANLVRHLGLADQQTRVYDVVQQLAQPSDELLARLGIDVVDIGRTFNERPEDWHPMVLPSGIEVQVPAWFQPTHQPDGAWDAFAPDGTRIATMPLGANFFDQTFSALTGLLAHAPTPPVSDGQNGKQTGTRKGSIVVPDRPTTRLGHA